MRITACINPRGTLIPTGQGKHAINMLLGLAACSDVSLSLLVSRKQLDGNGRIPNESPLAHLPVRSYALPQKIMHGLWRTVGLPKADRWCPDADWIYCPTENFVSARRPAFASTIHCVDWFEPNLPWYDSQENRAGRRRMAKLYACVFREARVVLTVSEFLKGRLCDLFGIDPARVAVIGNGVEQCFFDAGASTGPNPNGDFTNLLAVGALQSRKGAEYLLALGETLARRKSGLRLVVAGGAQGLPAFVARARACPNLEVLPYLPSSELASRMRSSLAVVVLSRSESFGIPAVEAMAAGVPVIASQFMALPEVVGKAGILVEVDRPETIVDVAGTLRADPSLRKRYVKLGLERAQQYTWQACVGRLVDTLRRFA